MTDGILRFLWESPEAPQTFVGVAFGTDGNVTFYDQPRLGQPNSTSASE
ncbi:hypothetical protein [Tenggerimyces flavus]|uniref:Uncharacterized protein n=1 Tax=Tenggerimyces flavus TaxID=1708749 RepID=A0ABV7Y3G6_9ACTN|nr:hypothetical protein [Tenggerimyces flavus]MBM7788647.1 hypothetical protein [Tenggerimyces flavus]